MFYPPLFLFQAVVHLESDAVRGHDDGLDVQVGELREKMVPVVHGGVIVLDERCDVDLVNAIVTSVCGLNNQYEGHNTFLSLVRACEEVE